jgi:hypothetical protein
MSFIILFALLGLFLAGFREGVWRCYTPEDVARWRAEAEATEVASSSPLLGATVPPVPAIPAFSRPNEPVKPALRPRPQPVLEAA